MEGTASRPIVILSQEQPRTGTAAHPIVVLSQNFSEPQPPAQAPTLLNLFDGEAYQPPAPTQAPAPSNIPMEEESSGLTEAEIDSLKNGIFRLLEQKAENTRPSNTVQTPGEFSRGVYWTVAWQVQASWGAGEEVHLIFDLAFNRWARAKRLPSVTSNFTEVEPEEIREPEKPKTKKPLNLIGFKPNRIY